MAKTAVGQLQEQIEAIRREAFAAGFAAAMQSVREFAARQEPGSDRESSVPRGGRRTTRTANDANPPDGHDMNAERRTARRVRRAGASRPQRGTNARLVEEILQTNAPRALRPAEIRTAIQRDKGVELAFTSIRHALGQLASRRIAEQVADSNAWRYRSGGGGEAAPAR